VGFEDGHQPEVQPAPETESVRPSPGSRCCCRTGRRVAVRLPASGRRGHLPGPGWCAPPAATRPPRRRAVRSPWASRPPIRPWARAPRWCQKCPTSTWPTARSGIDHPGGGAAGGTGRRARPGDVEQSDLPW